jgi:dTDP-4-amino-4,6-dideoxygalactose transaminase
MIQVFDYLRGYALLKDEIAAALQRVLESGQLILGPEVAAFEREFAAYVGAASGVGVNSGTDALTIALLAVGVGPGDEVLTVANTAVPTVAAIRAIGAVPRFVDVRPDTLLMNADLLPPAITPRTRCLLPVHLYGHPAEMLAILDIARQHRLPVVEDCAHAHGAWLEGRHAGTFGDIGCFSFYPTKNLGAYGDAGLCVTSNRDLETRLRTLRMYGFHQDRIAHGPGLNTRLDEMQAAILRVKLRRLDSMLAARRAIADQYLQGLERTALRLPPELPGARHAYHLFVIRTSNRAELMMALDAAGIDSAIHYAMPLHRMPAFQAFAPPSEAALPVTELAARQILSLPLFPELQVEEVAQVIVALRSVASPTERSAP